MVAELPIRTARLAVVGLALVYAGAHLAWYGTTPMGGFPVLDGREILDLAQEIANGTLPSEPFYRAPLYSALLALASKLGIADSFLPDTARLINLFAHACSTLLIFELARRAWTATSAGILAGTLYAVYPVAVHFASDPLDMSVGTALALAGTLAAWLAWQRGSSALAFLAASCVALAAMARPNFLLCLPALFLWLALMTWRDRRNLRLLLAAGAATALVLGSMGAINLAVGGEFRVLPWQGSHSFWDANGQGANGLFYSHTLQTTKLAPGQNPARAEAEAIYCQDRPCSEKLDIGDFQSYWRAKMLTYLQQHPVSVLKLVFSKAWYLVNNYEQYNNKTYWVHKERSPWLRWNPLCWAVLLAMAVAALWLPMRREARELLLLTLVCYAASLLIVFVSARFRVPMAAWLCVFAGGWATLWSRWKITTAGKQRLPGTLIVTALGVGAVAAFPVGDTLRNATVVEDHLLLSSASLAAGKWQDSEDWAQQVLALQPTRPIAHAMVCSARLYGWEMSPIADLPPEPWLRNSLDHCLRGIQKAEGAGYGAAIFLAGLCQRDRAVAQLELLRDSESVGDLARSALALAQHQAPSSTDAAAGLNRLKMKPADETTAGQRSMIAAFEQNCGR